MPTADKTYELNVTSRCTNHQTEQEPRYTIRRLTHYTSMAGANAASETSVDSKVNSIKNPAVIDNEKQVMD